MKKLLTIGHSYVVAQNRCLAHEFARLGAGRWEVTVAAPRWITGEIHPAALVVAPDEPCGVYGDTYALPNPPRNIVEVSDLLGMLIDRAHELGLKFTGTTAALAGQLLGFAEART